MPFWRCYYHVVWATKGREPLLTSMLEQVVFTSVDDKSTALGCQLLAVNAYQDHIHAAVSMPPTFAIADWVKHVKGVSSRDVNNAQPSNAARFRWQSSYGVVTVGEKHLPVVVDYIARQKEHHATGNLFQSLENTGE
jgi:putative transposase